MSHKVIQLYDNTIFCQDYCKINTDKIASFIKNKDCLDDLYFNQLHIDKYKELASVLNILFAISHSQASVERSLNLNKAILKDNIEQASVRSWRLIKDHFNMRNVKPHTIRNSQSADFRRKII